MIRPLLSRKIANRPLTVIIYALLALAFAFCQFVVLPVWSQTGTTTNSQTAPRKTSQPYTGDLSIFEEKTATKSYRLNA